MIRVATGQMVPWSYFGRDASQRKLFSHSRWLGREESEEQPGQKWSFITVIVWCTCMCSCTKTLMTIEFYSFCSTLTQYKRFYKFRHTHIKTCFYIIFTLSFFVLFLHVWPTSAIQYYTVLAFWCQCFNFLCQKAMQTGQLSVQPLLSLNYLKNLIFTVQFWEGEQGRPEQSVGWVVDGGLGGWGWGRHMDMAGC